MSDHWREPDPDPGPPLWLVVASVVIIVGCAFAVAILFPGWAAR